VDTTVRRAFGLGFKVEVASDGHSTTDGTVLTAEAIIRHHNEVFRMFADVNEARDITFTT
jgi:aminoglycoside 6'-N-acetyltransferase